MSEAKTQNDIVCFVGKRTEKRPENLARIAYIRKFLSVSLDLLVQSRFLPTQCYALTIKYFVTHQPKWWIHVKKYWRMRNCWSALFLCNSFLDVHVYFIGRIRKRIQWSFPGKQFTWSVCTSERTKIRKKFATQQLLQ